MWAELELHERAFRRLGGAPRVVVLDNLKKGVLAPDVYEPTLNPLYRDVLAHYGVVALPCRIRDPDRKGKAEAGIGHTQRTPRRGLRFETLEQAQAYLDRWDAHWADTRVHGTTKRQVAVMFAEERPALQPLPVEPFRYYRFGQRTVHLDGCVEVEAAYYSAPSGLDRAACRRAADRAARAASGAGDQAAPARACPGATRLAPDRRSRSPGAHAATDARAVRARPLCGRICTRSATDPSTTGASCSATPPPSRPCSIGSSMQGPDRLARGGTGRVELTRLGPAEMAGLARRRNSRF